MKIVLVPLSVDEERDTNLEAVAGFVAEIPEADLILFPEAALGPFPTGRDAERDLPFGEPIPGPATAAIGEIARRHDTWIGIGLTESCDGGLYDSAVLIAPDGKVALRYRRNHSGWFYPDADREVYRVGSEIPVAETPAGRTAMLICGDVFDDTIADRVRSLAPDLLLVPMARSLDGDLSGWEREVPEYAERVARIGVPTLFANRGDGEFVGGAMAITADGSVRSRLLPAAGRKSLLVHHHVLPDHRR